MERDAVTPWAGIRTGAEGPSHPNSSHWEASSSKQPGGLPYKTPFHPPAIFRGIFPQKCPSVNCW